MRRCHRTSASENALAPPRRRLAADTSWWSQAPARTGRRDRYLGHPPDHIVSFHTSSSSVVATLFADFSWLPDFSLTVRGLLCWRRRGTLGDPRSPESVRRWSPSATVRRPSDASSWAFNNMHTYREHVAKSHKTLDRKFRRSDSLALHQCGFARRPSLTSRGGIGVAQLLLVTRNATLGSPTRPHPSLRVRVTLPAPHRHHCVGPHSRAGCRRLQLHINCLSGISLRRVFHRRNLACSTSVAK